jgi:YidC/Oxa1 family membrane protein insertase
LNRDTVLAFVLILGVVLFFNTPLYYKLVGKPYPYGGPKAISADTAAVVDQPPVDSSVLGVAAASGNGEAQRATTARADSTRPNRSPETRQIAEARAHEMAGDTIWVETARLRIGIAQRGARIVSVRTKQYCYHRNIRPSDGDSAIELVSRAGGRAGLGLRIDSDSYDGTDFEYGGPPSPITVRSGDSAEIILRTAGANGSEVTKAFVFYGEGYAFGVSVRSPQLDGRNVRLSWACGVDESESRPGGKPMQYDRRKAHVFDGSEVEHIEQKKVATEERSGQYQWAAVTSKYFLVALMSATPREGDIGVSSFVDSGVVDIKGANFNYGIEIRRTADGGEERCRVYAGPMQIARLRAEHARLEKVLYGGWRLFLRADKWFPPICDVMLAVLLALGGLVKDYGVAIVLLTIIVKAATYPLSVSSMRSMGKMKLLQPKITTVRNRYKSDPRKMNEELLALYKKEGVNPFNPGCLPMLLQMPVLFALFVVLRKSIELRGTATVLVPWVKDLSQAEVLFRLPFSLPMYGDNFALMPIIMGVVTFVQNKMTIKDPNQKMMIYMMPVLMLAMFNAFPAGLVLYWTLSSALGLVQQRLIDRGIAVSTPAEPEEKPKPKHGRGRRR